MDKDLYTQSVEYEKLTQAIYQAILDKEGVSNVVVEHNKSIAGRSGVNHQIDVLWKFKQAGLTHTVLIECKNYSSSITLEKVRNFFAVIHDISNTKGLMVTKSGYQQGVKDFASYYGIDLKLLRKPEEDDWKDRIKDIHLSLVSKVPTSTEQNPITAELYLGSEDGEQEKRLNALQNSGDLHIPNGADICFLDENGIVATEEMRWWLPQKLEVLDKEPGGPYEQTVKLDNLYIWFGTGDNKELVKVLGLKVKYCVEILHTEEIAYHGEDVVKAILLDDQSGDVEHVHKN